MADVCFNFVDKVLKNHYINLGKIATNKGKNTCGKWVCN